MKPKHDVKYPRLFKCLRHLFHMQKSALDLYLDENIAFLKPVFKIQGKFT